MLIVNKGSLKKYFNSKWNKSLDKNLLQTYNNRQEVLLDY